MKRVVVTGLGTINPCGNNVADTWDAVSNGRSGIGPITAFDAADWPVRIAGEVKDWDPATALDRRAAKRMDRFMQFALVALWKRWRMPGSRLENGLVTGQAVWASGIGGIAELCDGAAIVGQGYKGLSPFLFREF